MRRIHHISADMLCDATEFLGHDVRLSNCVEELGLAMVYMPHDGDNWRTLFQLFGFVGGLFYDGLVVEAYDLDLAAVFCSQDGCSVRVDPLIDGSHHTERHQFTDQIGRLQIHFLCKLGNADILHNIDGFRDRSQLGFRLFFELNLFFEF